VRVRRVNGHIQISDRAGAHWLLGLFLLAGSVLALAAALGLVADVGSLRSWERGMVLVIGLGGGAGALWWLHRSPSTRVTFDLAGRRIQLVRLGLSGRHVQELGFEQAARVAVERGQDDEGGDVSRLVLHLRSGATVLLSELWSHDHRNVIAAASAVADACDLSPAEDL
jgi:hypothetical protein